MDNLAHALVGAALGRAVADRHVPRAGLIGVVAANAPDWAELFTGYPWPRPEYLVEHRGITHSLLGAVIETAGLVLIIGVVLLLLRRRPAWGWLLLCVGTTVLSHLYMDWQGSYGLRPFLPWDGTWYYGDWVAIVDPFFWLLPLIALAWGADRHWRPLAGVVLVGGLMTFALVRAADIVATWVLIAYALLCVLAIAGWIAYWFGPVERQRTGAVALVLLALYAGAQAVVVQGRKAEIRATARARFGPGAQWAALTNIGHPFTWEPIYAGADTIAGDDWRIPRHLDDPRVQRALATPDGRAMVIFARFLAADIEGETVFLLDARYARAARDGWAVVSVRTD
jgi:inner membrane protein